MRLLGISLPPNFVSSSNNGHDQTHEQDLKMGQVNKNTYEDFELVPEVAL